MKLAVESVEVKEIKSYIVAAKIPFTEKMLSSTETFTFKELFEALKDQESPTNIVIDEKENEVVVGELKENLGTDDTLTATIKANLSFTEEQILPIVKAKLQSAGLIVPLDQDIRVKIRNLKG